MSERSWCYLSRCMMRHVIMCVEPFLRICAGHTAQVLGRYACFASNWGR